MAGATAESDLDLIVLHHRFEAAYPGRKEKITSTLVVLHPMKKQEVKVRYRLSETKGAYRLVDVTFEGDESLLTHVRDEQIRPLMADGGWDGLLEQLRGRVAEIEARRQG